MKKRFTETSNCVTANWKTTRDNQVQSFPSALAIIRGWWTNTIAIGPLELLGTEDGTNEFQIAPFPFLEWRVLG
jgi:hypothetical protein